MDEKQFPQEEPIRPLDSAGETPEPETQTPAPAAPELPEEEADLLTLLVGEQEPEKSSGEALLTTPELAEELTADEQAMDFQGMLGHDEEEPPFDLSILDDPAFDEPAPEPPEEEVDDQEYRDNGQEVSEASDASANSPQSPAHRRSTRKGRPKKRGGEGLLGIPSILSTIVWLALILAIGVTIGRMAWVCAADVLAFGREDRPVTVTIYEADTMEDITNKLYDAGLIRYKSLFNLYASISDAREDIKPGIYDLNTRYDYHALVNFMTPKSSREVVELTIPEGYSCRQIFALLEENRICTAVDIAAYAADGELNDYWFLEGVERGSKYCLEGFLFPDTYEFYKNSTPREALQRMLDNFDRRVDEEMREQLVTLNAHISEMMRADGRSEEYIAEHLFTIREVAIVASFIEKETSGDEESPVIASVIYNRLFSWGSTPAYLNIDASVIYALDGKTDLTSEDMRVDSPYNTYLNTGLTPTPISNPGLASLKAALAPDSTTYYFYVLNPATGTHQFSETIEEHNEWVAKFASEG